MIIDTNRRQYGEKVKHKKKKKASKNTLAYKRDQAYKLKLNQQRNKSANEVRFIGLLMEIDVKFIWQQPFYNKERYVCVDFYFPEQNIVIELDGVEHKKRIEKDRERTNYLKRVHGVNRVIRYTNKQLALDYYNVLDSVDYELNK